MEGIRTRRMVRPHRGADARRFGNSRVLGTVDHGDEQIDAWISDGAVESGRAGHVEWSDDGEYLFASARWSDDGGRFDQRVQDTYRDLLSLMSERGYRHALRYWNYLPHINRVESSCDGGPLERYRQFNAARQRAFKDADQTVLQGAPAACALGSADGWARIAVLAGRHAPMALENPRQVSAYRYPAQYGARSPTFSRGALVRIAPDTDLLLISGTASIVGHASLHTGDACAQTVETLRNLQAMVDAANGISAARFELTDLDLTLYVRQGVDRATVRSVLQERLGTSSHALGTLFIVQADVCRRELLVEIEAHGLAIAPVAPIAPIAQKR